MGKCSPMILDGDGEADCLSHINKLIGYDTPDYTELSDDEMEWEDLRYQKIFPPRELLEKNLMQNSKLLDRIQNWTENTLEFLVLGGIVVITGAKMPEDVKLKILTAIEWSIVHEKWNSEKFARERKKALLDLKYHITNYIPGTSGPGWL